jgi:hypothetical protein
VSRKEFEAVVAQAPREKIVYQNLSFSSTLVASGATHEVLIYAPANRICEVTMFHALIGLPGGVISGSHDLWLQTTSNFGSFLFGRSDYTKELNFQSQHWRIANIFQEPPNNPVEGLRSCIFDDTVGAKIKYTNQLNVANDANKYLAIQYLERQVTK